MAAAPSCKSLNPNSSPKSQILRRNSVGARSPAFSRRRWIPIRSDLSNRVRIPQSSSSSLMAAVAPSVAAAVSLPPRRSKKNVFLFYCQEMRELAERVAAESDAIELRSINWRCNFNQLCNQSSMVFLSFRAILVLGSCFGGPELSLIQGAKHELLTCHWTFEDGFPNLFIPNAHGIRGEHVAFLASFSSPEVIFGQISIIYALPSLFISSFTLVLPYFPTGTSERMEEEGDVATAYTLARILSNTPISRGGPTNLVIFDIHALQERFYFGDSVLPCFESGVPLLKKRLQQLPDSDNISIAFPDDGSWKRFHKLLQHYPVIICTKVREGDQRFIRIKEGDPRGRHIVIVDDLVQSGSTLIECQKVLAAHGAVKVSAYVTHGIFPNRSWERFQCDKGAGPDTGMSYFWITDSCPGTAREVKYRPPFEILSLADSIAAALQI